MDDKSVDMDKKCAKKTWTCSCDYVDECLWTVICEQYA